MKLDIELTLTRDMLGSKPRDEDIHSEYVTSKAPTDEKAQEEEKAASRIEGDEDNLKMKPNVFHRDEDGTLIIWDYQLKGFLKEAGNVIRGMSGPESLGDRKGKKWGSIKGKVDNYVFVFPRKLKLGVKEWDP